MDTENQYYQLPENSSQTVRTMMWSLAAFFVILIAVIALFVINAQKIAVNIPFSAEKRFIRPYEEALRKWFPGESNPVVDEYLQNLADDLSKKMDVPADYEINVHYVDADVENAFATLGGHIFIFQGLLRNTPDENSLAMVLSHEIAHIKHRDPMAAMGRGFAIQALYGFITNDYSNAVDIVTASGEVGLSFFSREQETAADVQALMALNAHYGHVAGFDDFFARMQQTMEDSDEGYEVPEWLATHPDLEKRIVTLNERINELDLTLGQRKEFPATIQELVIEEEELDAEQDEKKPSE